MTLITGVEVEVQVMGGGVGVMIPCPTRLVTARLVRVRLEGING